MNRRYLLIKYIVVAFLFPCLAGGQVFDMVVAPDGDYTSIQSALNAVSDNSPERTLILVWEGTYNEKVVLGSAKINVSLIGEDPEKVKITWDDYAGKDGMSSAETYTFWADANDFYAENISFMNSAGPVGQALAIRTTGDRMVFKNCHFIGHKDTYYAHKRRQYNVQCRIEGTTDFIYGDATTVFDKCTVHCKKGGSYITAPADTKLISNTPEGTFYHGLLFLDCDVKADSDVSASSYYLGRPWQPNASSVFIRCRFGDHIKPAGWSTWSGDNHLSGCYAEYQSIDLDGNLVDVSNRVDWSKQLTSKEVVNYYNLDYFLKKSGVIWDPLHATTASDPPSGLWSNGNDLSWKEVTGAIGYMIYRNDSLFVITDSASHVFSEMPSGINSFTVRSVSEYGNLSPHSDELNIHGPLAVEEIRKTKLEVFMSGNSLRISEPVRYRIYSLTGSLIKQGYNSTQVNLSDCRRSIYVVRLVRADGMVSTFKIFRK